MVVTSLSTRELIRELRALHLKHGDNPDPSNAVLSSTVQVCKELEVRGVHSRYIDDLARASATKPGKDLPSPTIEEVLLYAEPVRLDQAAVCLAKRIGADDNTIYVTARSPMLREMTASIVQAVKRCMPPGVEVSPVGMLQEDNAYLQAQAAYALELVPAARRERIVTTALAQPLVPKSKVFKTWNSKIPFHALKTAPVERIVTGVVLEPDTIDGTVTEQTEGDIYSRTEIQKGMYFWMEHAGAPFSFHHVEQGGQRLEPGDVVLLENWQARSNLRLGSQDIKEGAWMMTTRVNHKGLWESIVKGEVNSWSLGLDAMGALENFAQSF